MSGNEEDGSIVDIEKIAVLGAGHGGHAVSADLTLAGYRVNLYNRSREPLEAIIKKGGIEISGIREGFAKLNKVTNNIKEAIEDVDLIVVVVPTNAHRSMAEACAPHLRDGQIIYLNPGHTGGALEFAKTLRDLEIKSKIRIGESSTLSFICRLQGPARVRVTARTQNLLFSAFPARDTPEIIDLVKEVFPTVIPAANVLETGLSNINAVEHPPGMLMNAGWIEHTQGNFLFYFEGVTPSIARVAGVVDAERSNLMKALGLKPVPIVQDMFEKGITTVRDGSVYEAFKASEPNKSIKAPKSLRDRYVEEDVGYGLVPMALIGKVIGVSTPTMDTLINLASLANDVDYWKEGRTLEKMGIAGMSNLEELKRFVTYGYAT